VNQFTNHSNELFYKFQSTFCSFTVSKRDACHRHHDPKRAEGQLRGHDHHQGPVRNSRHFLLHVRKIEVKLFSRAKNGFYNFCNKQHIIENLLLNDGKNFFLNILTLSSLKQTVYFKHFTRCQFSSSNLTSLKENIIKKLSLKISLFICALLRNFWIDIRYFVQGKRRLLPASKNCCRTSWWGACPPDQRPATTFGLHEALLLGVHRQLRSSSRTYSGSVCDKIFWQKNELND